MEDFLSSFKHDFSFLSFFLSFFFFFWLYWVFIAAREFSLVAVHRLLVAAASLVVEHGL